MKVWVATSSKNAQLKTENEGVGRDVGQKCTAQNEGVGCDVGQKCTAQNWK